MKRFRSRQGDWIESPKIDTFLLEIESVCRKHNLSLSHEDYHGAFEVTEFDETFVDWLKDAHDERSVMDAGDALKGRGEL